MRRTRGQRTPPSARWLRHNISIKAISYLLYCAAMPMSRCNSTERFRVAASPDPAETVRRAQEGPLRDGRDPSDGSCPAEDVCLGDPPGTPRRTRQGLRGGGCRHLVHRQPRGAGARDGRGRQLQRRLGRSRPADQPLRRPWRALPHRRVRCGGHRLGRGRQGEELEGRATRSSSTATRTTATTRNATAATRCSRPRSGSGATRRPTAPSPVHPRAGAAADAAAQAPDLGRERLLHADARHRLPDALRPSPA
jgi:hypothetical protein